MPGTTALGKRTPAARSDLASAAQLNPKSFAAWGDSLTAGTGTNTSWPTQLRNLISGGAKVYNGGVGGDTSSQILTRFQTDTTHLNATVVIWAGRNNFANQSQVLSDVAVIVAALPSPKRFLVLSVLNGRRSTEWSGQTNYTQIVNLNAALAAAYPGNYLDIRSYLVGQYNAGNAVDVLDHGNDTVPRSLAATTTNTATLTSTITAAATSFALTFTVGGLAIDDVLLIDSEYIRVTAISGNTVTSCTRGYAGTTAASHTAGAAVVDPDQVHLTTAGYALVAAQVKTWLDAHPLTSTAVGAANLPTALRTPPPIGADIANTGAFAADADATDLRAFRVNPGQSGAAPAGAATLAALFEAPNTGVGCTVGILANTGQTAALYFGTASNVGQCQINSFTAGMGLVAAGSFSMFLAGSKLGIGFNNANNGSIDSQLTIDATVTNILASTASNGTTATKALRVQGGTGQATTGTTGQSAGAGADALITAGTGGAAPAGSTNGAGGSITLQAGTAGAGAGTAAAAGSVKINPSGAGALGFWGVTPTTRPSLTYSRATENAAQTQLRTALAALGLVADNTTA